MVEYSSTDSESVDANAPFDEAPGRMPSRGGAGADDLGADAALQHIVKKCVQYIYVCVCGTSEATP